MNTPDHRAAAIDTMERAALAEQQNKHHQLAHTHPVDQAHRIATHYLSVANLARDLHDLTRAYQAGARDSATEKLIAELKRQIQRHHLEDFGLALYWQNPPA